MLSDEQCKELIEWLSKHENIGAQADEIVTTGKTLDYYIGCWGPPQKSDALVDGAAVSVWRGEGYLFLIADFGDFRAAAVY